MQTEKSQPKGKTDDAGNEVYLGWGKGGEADFVSSKNWFPNISFGIVQLLSRICTTLKQFWEGRGVGGGVQKWKWQSCFP